MELSWSLRTFEGDSIEDCADARIERVRLCWIPLEADAGASGGGGCRPPNLEDFDCEKESGVTGFDVPPGRTSIFILPICAGDRPAQAGTYEVPPPIVRTVEEGKVVTLNSLLIVATDFSSDKSACPAAGCICSF